VAVFSSETADPSVRGAVDELIHNLDTVPDPLPDGEA
jgi:hypothetical protein